MREQVYSSDPILKSPGRLMRAMIRDLVLSRELAWRLAARDIKAQFRQSLLGYLWAFIPPILIAASFLFLRSARYFDVSDTGAPYTAFVITGALLWQTFSDAVVAPLRMMSASREILVKVSFPREALILGGVLVTAFGALVRMAVLIPVFWHFGISAGADWLYVPIGIAALIGAGTCFGLLLTPLGILYKDVEKGLAPLLVLWMLISPVGYPVSPEAVGSFVHRFNFVSPLLITTRNWMLGVGAVPLTDFLAVIVVTILCSLLGWLMLRLAIPHLIARLGM